MCKCNEEDYDCDDCAYQLGKEDAECGEPDNPPYKNWSQCNCYHDGYRAGLNQA